MSETTDKDFWDIIEAEIEREQEKVFLLVCAPSVYTSVLLWVLQGTATGSLDRKYRVHPSPYCPEDQLLVFDLEALQG